MKSWLKGGLILSGVLLVSYIFMQLAKVIDSSFGNSFLVFFAVIFWIFGMIFIGIWLFGPNLFGYFVPNSLLSSSTGAEFSFSPTILGLILFLFYYFIIGSVIGLIANKLKYENWPIWLRYGVTLICIFIWLFFLILINYIVSFIFYKNIGGDSPEIFIFSIVILLIVFVLIFLLGMVITWIKSRKK